MDGWIKIYRELLNKPIWQKSNAKQKAILITLLLMANHEENEWEWQGQKFKVTPGQFVTSLENIAKKAGSDISIKNVRTAIERFKKYDFLTNKSTKTGRLITITNWGLYQIKEKKRQSNRQSGGKEVATNKNDKNDKNIFIKPTIEEIKEYCSKRENDIDAERFFDFYEAKGWMVGKNKMRDWKAGVRTWERNNKKEVNEHEEYYLPG